MVSISSRDTRNFGSTKLDNVSVAGIFLFPNQKHLKLFFFLPKREKLCTHTSPFSQFLTVLYLLSSGSQSMYLKKTLKINTVYE